MEPVKKILIIPDSAVSDKDIDAAIRGIRAIESTIELPVAIMNLREKHTLEILAEPERHTFGKPTLYFKQAEKNKRGYSEAHSSVEVLFALALASPWRKLIHPYFLFIASCPLYAQSMSYLTGWYCERESGAVSVCTDESFDSQKQTRYMATLTAHTMGHVFGLIPEDRTERVAHIQGLHCSDEKCIMRHSGNKWQRDFDRINDGLFCSLCSRDLKQLVATPVL